LKNTKEHYHDGAVGFSSSSPDPFVAVGNRTQGVPFAAEELALSVGTAQQEIIAASVPVRYNPANVETQRFLTANL
jgi:hypothetical protein